MLHSNHSRVLARTVRFQDVFIKKYIISIIFNSVKPDYRGLCHDIVFQMRATLIVGLYVCLLLFVFVVLAEFISARVLYFYTVFKQMTSE